MDYIKVIVLSNPFGTSGARCETNVNDCRPGVCGEHGLCVDQLNGFNCTCLSSFSGDRCETRIQSVCERSPCSNGGVCTDINQYWRKCDCPVGFFGSSCGNQIDMCKSSPCQNGASCINVAGGFDCVCNDGFTGDTCESPLRTCAATGCGNSVNCVNDPITGLPRCLCNHGYSLGLYCQYKVQTQTTVNSQTATILNNVAETDCMRRVESGAVDSYVGFVYNITARSCSLLTSDQSLQSTQADNCCRVYTKLCSHQVDDFWTPWYNTNRPTVAGHDVETRSSLLTIGIEVCKRTLPLSAECRIQGDVSASFDKRVCSLDGLNCTAGVHTANFAPCPDFEVRFQCSVTRVFQNKKCTMLATCAEQGNPCENGGSCEDVVGGFRCSCLPGYTGQRCQHSVDDCAGQPCHNGNLCEENVDDCNPKPCDVAGSVRCIDGANSYTCDCKTGYTGKNCSSVINECESEPCLHGGTCLDNLGGFMCDCIPGWTGQHCDILVNRCTQNSCPNGAECVPLFNDFTCTCNSYSFGPVCERIPSLCQVANPCVKPTVCYIVNSTDAACTCPADKAGDGCHLFIDNSCTNSLCQNGGTCKRTADADVLCSCSTGFTGRRCETRIKYCQNVVCPGNSTCFEGVDRHFCRCPLGKATPDCTDDIDIDYDICFKSSVNGGSAYLPYAIPATWTDGLSVSMWFKFSTAGSVGTFLSLYETRSPGFLSSLKKLFYVNEKGLYAYFSDTEEFLPFLDNSTKSSDGMWHNLAVSWQRNTGTLSLILDNVVQKQLVNYAPGRILSKEIWLSLGSHSLPSEPRSSLFVGCISQVNVYSRFVDFLLEDRGLVNNPKTVFSNSIVLRWSEHLTAGNTQIVRPSSARRNSCPSGFSDPPGCTTVVRETTALRVKSCPSNMFKESLTPKTFVTWTEPQFDGAVIVKSNYKSGAVMSQGHHVVVYEAKDESGNAVTCTFTVYITADFCPDLDDPRGGGNETCFKEQGDVPFTVCTVGCRGNTSVLVDPTPQYFTCGPSGAWNSLSQTDGLYPPCGRVVGRARADVDVSVSYFTTGVSCGDLEFVMKQRVPRSLSNLDMCQTDNCSNVTIQVDCSKPPSISLAVHINNASSEIQSGANILPVEKILIKAVLDENIFTYQLTNTETKPDPNSLDIHVVLRCDTGQVVVKKLCVQCGPGTFFNSATKHCDNCPEGRFQANLGALNCEACPLGKTTDSVGAISADSCYAICPAGKFFNTTSNQCESCPVGFYQNVSGSFSCKPCPLGTVNFQPAAATVSLCVDVCPSGSQLEFTGGCEVCPVGTYRHVTDGPFCRNCPEGLTTAEPGAVNSSICFTTQCVRGYHLSSVTKVCEKCPLGTYQPLANQTDCVSCPPGKTTDDTGSTGQNQCVDIAQCVAGYQLNTVKNVCEKCPVGTYQPSPNQTHCVSCLTGKTTEDTGSTGKKQCIVPESCPLGEERVSGSCQDCAVGFYKNTTLPSRTCQPCPAGYVTLQTGSTSINDCSIRICSAGYKVIDIAGGGKDCEACQRGEYQPLQHQPSCLPCPAGHTTPTTASTSNSQCQKFCQSGEELVSGNCVVCQRGYYRDITEGTFLPCKPCPSEFITKQTGSKSLADCTVKNCSAGTYLDEQSNTCVPCSVGFYQPDSWQTECVQCLPGTSTKDVQATSSTDCILVCPAGSQVQSGTCQPCPVGFYKHQDGFLPCTPCPGEFRTATSGAKSADDCNIVGCSPGSYLHVNNSCLPCPTGEYQPNKWQDSCTPCNSGSTTSTQGSVNASQCVVICDDGLGYNAAIDSCKSCDIGFYRNKTTDGPLCKPCPADKISQIGAVNLADCDIANCTRPGQYRNIMTNRCEDCPIGSYQNQKWMEQCVPCQKGLTTKITAATSSSDCYRDCPSGQQVIELTNVCTACLKGTYRKRLSTWTCQPCLSKFTTNGTGAIDESQCMIALCDVGNGYNTQSKTCEPCPIGTYQNTKNEPSCLPCPNNTTTLSVGTINPSDCTSLCTTGKHNCTSNTVCVDISASPGFDCQCKPGFTGSPRCKHVCEIPDYCQNGGTCRRDSNPLCECTASYEGDRCQIPKLVDVVSSDMIVGIVVGITAFLLICILILVGVITAHR
ncbi:uncharacterized protein LOC121379488 [Gigantopelta aegis]|uniref:uncharacterized protein LOC121379488 n=1 Tax=Gigantopelta aegis TaxID=1735272 RepID=UPI001B8884E3|nr:uncharacterized protein LOC121379488 [Gigantopelta aegis]